MKQKIMFWISLLLQVIQVVTVSVAVRYVQKLDMIPDRYMRILYIGAIAVLLITGLLMFLRRKRPPCTVRRVIAWVLVAFTVAGCVILSRAVSRLHNTVDAITTTIVSEETREVYVMKDDPARSIQDAADYVFGIVEAYDTENTTRALDVIAEELNCEVTTRSFPSVVALVDGLYNGEIQALILNSGYLSILELYPDYADYADFSEKTRVLYSATLEITVPPTTEPPETQPSETQPTINLTEPAEPVMTDPPSVVNTPFIIYISGSDSRSSSLQTKTRSDVNILAVVNPQTHQVLLLNTPRDYYIANPAGGGAMDKLTHCGVYGIECSIEALENLYGIAIDYYAKINFTGFETLIDSVGGVTVYADQSFKAIDYYFEKGENVLDGKAALAFARERYHVAGGDSGRGKNQMKVITAVIRKLTSGSTIISRYSDILSSLEGMFTTSFPMEDVSKLVKMQLDEMPSWEIYSFAVSGRTGSDVNYSMPGMRASVMYQNKELVDQASSLVNKVLSGERISQKDLQTDE